LKNLHPPQDKKLAKLSFNQLVRNLSDADAGGYHLAQKR